MSEDNNTRYNIETSTGAFVSGKLTGRTML